MGEMLGQLRRTHMAGLVDEKFIGQEVIVTGWVAKRRNLGSLIFCDVRDTEGILQVVFREEDSREAYEKADRLRNEFCILVRGTVAKRESVNDSIPTGQVELIAKELKILSESETPPIYIKENLDAAENVRLKYRYLDLRRPDMQRIFKIRSKAYISIRNFMDGEGFLEVETPILNKSTPEGARDYLVPSRNYPGSFYALPQSPQIFKQLLMVSGFDKYFQIAKCFRDEDLRANRQPEFTQIDIEMSFIGVEDIIDLNERLVQRVFKEVLDKDIALPFERLTYKEAMERFGSDKPDLRFGMELKNLTDLVENSDFAVFKNAIEQKGSVRAITLSGGASMGRKDIDRLGEFVKTYRAKGLAYIQLKEEGIKSPLSKFLSEEEFNAIIERSEARTGDVIFIVADKNEVVFQSLGALRLELAKKYNLLEGTEEFKFAWVTEFPLLERDEEAGRFVALHHPFTSPMEEDLHLLDTDPGAARAKAYDMVLNGEELGGGSIRIHDSKLQEKMFTLLGFSKEEAWERFGFLLEAFKYGPPPHGGLAFGMDRLVMFLAGTDNIKDVIAFPKNQNAYDPMSEAPNTVDPIQLKELGIDVVKKTEE
ncbi:aspartate--tRNA ligase [Proteiniclasticum sp. SCR006]|uniref:Aspartate--tRNA ligase n=1 Tax=Proteiniclasticum aestuarii TaxID=2817862 RepID=A0A939HA00_9CLOT|nr:aspartate--tRNA ligase [Proteiniclasticum aestuarii]MBO1263780.1 aspartate--tRNA ligase [Proteiniclasticum aestuarii]